MPFLQLSLDIARATRALRGRAVRTRRAVRHPARTRLTIPSWSRHPARCRSGQPSSCVPSLPPTPTSTRSGRRSVRHRARSHAHRRKAQFEPVPTAPGARVAQGLQADALRAAALVCPVASDRTQPPSGPTWTWSCSSSIRDLRSARAPTRPRHCASSARFGRESRHDGANHGSQARFIDYGCGSGILAIAALRLGARRAMAMDIDRSPAGHRENAERNAVQARIQITADREVEKAQADVLLANILAGPLVELAPCWPTGPGSGARSP